MNIFKKIWARIYQGVFRIALPFLPYKNPKLLNNNQEIVDIFKDKNINNVLLVTDSGISKLNLYFSLVEKLNKNNIKVVVYDKTVPNPTTKNVEESLTLYKNKNCQAIIAFGGGSPIDCAKATGVRIARPNKNLNDLKGILKVHKKLPLLIAVPTTAGTGSETTITAVIKDSDTNHKYTINDFPLMPKYALLDASLTVGLPKHITSTTGLDALTHAIEAYIGRSTTKYTKEMSLKAIKLIFENIETAFFDGQNLEARKNMLLASYYAGIAFTRSYVGYVHAVAHSLGGEYNIAHGLANAVILPYMLKMYGKKIYKKLWNIGIYLNLFDKSVSYNKGANLLIEKIEKLNLSLNIPTNLPQIEEKDIIKLAKYAAKEANPLYPVPVLYTAKDLEKIYYEVKNG